MTPELKIATLPAAILRKKAERIEHVTGRIRETLDAMARAMYLNNGVGLAAVQVSIDKQLAVVDVGDKLIKLINPVITKREGLEAQEEGCLSVPGLIVNVKRNKKIAVSFLNEDGTVVRLEAKGLLARAIQHEIDHLSGKLIVDYMNPIKKLFVKKGGRRQKLLDKIKAI